MNMSTVSELEFNVPFQHKHGYIRDECEHSNIHLPLTIKNNLIMFKIISKISTPVIVE